MSASLLKGDVLREGFMKKSASSKKGDQVRGTFKERWFVLKGTKLLYYKRKEDRTPKGELDMRAAQIEVADKKNWKAIFSSYSTSEAGCYVPLVR
jgi:hypothetical protein